MLEFDGRFRQGSILFVNTKWCGYSRDAVPILEKVSDTFGNAIPVYDVDGDIWREFLSLKMHDSAPRTYPTILFIGSNGEVSTFEDERSVENIVAWACALAGHHGRISACPTIQ